MASGCGSRRRAPEVRGRRWRPLADASSIGRERRPLRSRPPVLHLDSCFVVINRTKRRRKTEINALHEDDLESFLQKLGLMDAYRSESLRCAICAEPLRSAGVGAARSRESEIAFACTRIGCMRELT